MTIQRRYEPNPEALDRVVDILCRLLVESPESTEHGGKSPVADLEPPCFPTEYE